MSSMASAGQGKRFLKGKDFAGEVSREIRYISNVEGWGQFLNPAPIESQ